MERLPADVPERIVMAVTRWATSDHGDLKPLHNIPGATHRLRVGDWRVLCVLDAAEHTALVRGVAPGGTPAGRSRACAGAASSAPRPRSGGPPATPLPLNAGAGHLQAALEGSLRRLGADRVDLLLIHRPDPLTHPRGRAAALGALVRRGLAGAVGVGNFTAAQARAGGVPGRPAAASQPSFSLWNLAPLEDGTLDICEEFDLLPMAYSPLGGGRLPGNRALPAGDPAEARLETLRGVGAVRRCPRLLGQPCAAGLAPRPSRRCGARRRQPEPRAHPRGRRCLRRPAVPRGLVPPLGGGPRRVPPVNTARPPPPPPQPPPPPRAPPPPPAPGVGPGGGPGGEPLPPHRRR